jgi:predicted double-glycine peptidase
MSRSTFAAAAAWAVLLCSCATVEQSTTSREFKEAHSAAEFCELKAVKQENASACGAACLASLFDYWELDGSQRALLKARPPATSKGYSMKELKEIAESSGLTAFSVSLEPQPLPLLFSQLEKGRPTILAIRCPRGRYFGDPVPVIERWDSSVVGVSLTEERFTGVPLATTRDRKKEHYVIAFGYDKSAKKILLMDPAYGLVSVAEHRLLTFWREQNYAALVCAPRIMITSGNSMPNGRIPKI